MVIDVEYLFINMLSKILIILNCWNLFVRLEQFVHSVDFFWNFADVECGAKWKSLLVEPSGKLLQPESMVRESTKQDCPELFLKMLSIEIYNNFTIIEGLEIQINFI